MALTRIGKGQDRGADPGDHIMGWFDPLVNQAMARKAKRMEANGAGKVSARDDDTIFLGLIRSSI
jgi:hypothetical protein